MTITYDELEQAWKREVHNSEIQPLRGGFLKEVSSYVKRLKESQRNVDLKSLKAVLMEEEVQRIARLLNDLLERRLYKLWSQASQTDSGTLEQSERKMVQELSVFRRDYARISQDVMQGREPSVSKSKDRQFVLIRFVRDVPSIIGVDLKAHGPFHKEDVARLPRENGESLVRQGAAMEVMMFDQDNE